MYPGLQPAPTSALDGFGAALAKQAVAFGCPVEHPYLL